MLTRLKVRNFKTLDEIDIEIGQTVVFIGPNNSGKTSALQALALWQSGVREWLSPRAGSTASERTGVTLNRLGLTHTPIAEARLLWRNLRVNAQTGGGDGTAQDVFIDVLVEGQDAGGLWSCGLEFHYGNAESIYCRPLRLPASSARDRMDVPAEAANVRIAFLPPMSGLATDETEVPAGRIDVLIGEGQTAQVLRNLCLRVHEGNETGWNEVKSRIGAMFGVSLRDPVRDKARGSIRLTYDERGHELDIASAGRGLQQTLLLLSHVFANPGSALLLDEPDAHLEILRQRQIYNLLSECAAVTGSQIIAASHSEVVLNEAAERDLVIAFVGRRPHRIIDRGSQLLKSLREIGFDQYYQADLKGAVLYLEGATDLSILRALAKKLGHRVSAVLERPFVHYVANQPIKALQHFFGLREARPDLVAFAVFDRLDRGLPAPFEMPAHCWRKCEIENYVVSRNVMLAFSEGGEPSDLVGQAVRNQKRDAMEKALTDVETAFRILNIDPWSDDIKVSERVLPAIFDNYYKNLGLRNEMSKADFHSLVDYCEASLIDPEVGQVLDRLLEVMERANPAG
jgi:energy-coupling factor transporter ATP-binding protein EcfA2